MKLSFLLILAVLFLSSCNEITQSNYKALKASCAEKLHEKDVSHEKRSISEYTCNFGLSDLRNKSLNNDTGEIRVWHFGDYIIPTFQERILPASVFVVGKSNRTWSARFLGEEIKNHGYKNERRELIEQRLGNPKIGWKQFWDKLVANGVTNISAEDSFAQCDGITLVIESNQNGTYKVQSIDTAEKQRKIRTLISENLRLD